MTTPTDGEKNPFEDLVLELVEELFDSSDTDDTDTDTDTEDTDEEIDRE
jgi:hypothetical protein